MRPSLDFSGIKDLSVEDFQEYYDAEVNKLFAELQDLSGSEEIEEEDHLDPVEDDLKVDPEKIKELKANFEAISLKGFLQELERDAELACGDLISVIKDSRDKRAKSILLEQSFADDFSFYTFPLLSDNFIISTYDKLTQIKRDHLMILLAKITVVRVPYEPLELGVQCRYSDLEYLPLSDGKSVLYRNDVFLSFILQNVQFEDFCNEVNRHENKTDILNTIFEITPNKCLYGNNKEKLKSAYKYLQQCVSNLSSASKDDLVSLFSELGFDQDTIVKQFLLNVKQDWTKLSTVNQDVLSFVLFFFPYEDYKESFERSFDSFQNRRYVLSEPVSISKNLFADFEIKLLDLLPQTIFQTTTFKHYLDLYNNPIALRTLLKCDDVSHVTYFQRVMLAAKATMVDYEKEFSDLKVNISIRKLFRNISNLKANIELSQFYNKFYCFIDTLMPKRLKGIDLSEKLEYLNSHLNNLVKSGEVYDLYEHLDELNLLGKRAKTNFPQFAINGLLKLKASTIKQVIDFTPNIFETISSHQDSDRIFAIIDSLIPTELIEELRQNPIEVFKQKLKNLYSAIEEYLSEPMSRTSSPITESQIDSLYNCFYNLDLCPNLELPDNSKLTTQISKYRRENLSSFSSLANSLSSYDQAVRADSPSSYTSSSSEGKEFEHLTLVSPVHQRKIERSPR